jgi:dGTPase
MDSELKKAANACHGCLSGLKTLYGRRRDPEDDDPLAVADPFVADEAKLLSSKAFRVLSYKTQVLTNPKNPFVRTRRAHVDEVVACSVVVSDMLGLNTNLVRSIALGHDIGHVPLGHPGEAFLAKAMGREEFCHEVMGPLVAQKVERQGRGLNLTFETLDGMMRHSGNKARAEMTQEAWVVRYTDKFAYIFHDYNDLTRRMNFKIPKDVTSIMNEFGTSQRERTSHAMSGLILESADLGRVSFEKSVMGKRFTELRGLMMGVYIHVTQQNLERIMSPVLEFLQELNQGDPFLLFALLTDRDVIALSELPTRDASHLQGTAISEVLQYMDDIGQLDLCSPYLDW